MESLVINSPTNGLAVRDDASTMGDFGPVQNITLNISRFDRLTGGDVTVTGNDNQEVITVIKAIPVTVRANGGDGDDELRGDAGSDGMAGGKGNDKLFGGAGFDTLLGEAGNDNLFGQGGEDILVGGGGINTSDKKADVLTLLEGETPPGVDCPPIPISFTISAMNVGEDAANEVFVEYEKGGPLEIDLTRDRIGVDVIHPITNQPIGVKVLRVGSFVLNEQGVITDPGFFFYQAFAISKLFQDTPDPKLENNLALFADIILACEPEEPPPPKPPITISTSPDDATGKKKTGSASFSGPQLPASSEIGSVSNNGFAFFTSNALDIYNGISSTSGSTHIGKGDPELIDEGPSTTFQGQTLRNSGNGSSDQPLASADGRFVAFRSEASNLVAGVQDNFRVGSATQHDIFLKDTQTGLLFFVSRSATTAGRSANRESLQLLDLSSDGRFTYTPKAGFFGEDRFDYVVRDATGSRFDDTIQGQRGVHALESGGGSDRLILHPLTLTPGRRAQPTNRPRRPVRRPRRRDPGRPAPLPGVSRRKKASELTCDPPKITIP